MSSLRGQASGYFRSSSRCIADDDAMQQHDFPHLRRIMSRVSRQAPAPADAAVAK